MAGEEVWVWCKSSYERHVVLSENQARAVCFAQTLHLIAQIDGNCLLACNSSFRHSSNSPLLPIALSHGDRLGRQRVHFEACQFFLSTLDLQHLNCVTFIQAWLSQNWI